MRKNQNNKPERQIVSIKVDYSAFNLQLGINFDHWRRQLRLGEWRKK